MALKDDIKPLLKHYNSQKSRIDHNNELFEIWEGDLLKYVLESIKSQMTEQSLQQIKYRVAPINILKRMIDKLSKIYARPPQRIVLNGNEADDALLSFYELETDINTNMSVANELFNLNKGVLVEPFIENGTPKLRSVPADRFTVWSNDLTNPTRMTHLIKTMGKTMTSIGVEEEILFLYTDEEFLIISESGDIQRQMMTMFENEDGVNPFGKIPGVYINRSRHSLIAPKDSDTLRMTKLIPVLMSDLNYAVMFQAFSIIYGIDVDDENLVHAPNAFWNLKSDKTGDTKPQVGTIKPTVDIDQVMRFILAQVSLWLQSRNIRMGAVGDLTAETAASGLSKAVDEMDTFEDRQNQVPFFRDAEQDLLDLLLRHMHPVWVDRGQIESKHKLSPGARFQVIFPEQRPSVSRADVLANIEKEIALGVLTKRRGLMRLEPDMEDKEVDELLAEVEAEATVEVEQDPVVSEETEPPIDE